MAALDGLDATKRKKIERFVEKKIEDVLERVGALGVIMVVAQAREENEIVESQRRRRALLQGKRLERGWEVCERVSE